MPENPGSLPFYLFNQPVDTVLGIYFNQKVYMVGHDNEVMNDKMLRSHLVAQDLDQEICHPFSLKKAPSPSRLRCDEEPSRSCRGILLIRRPRQF